LDFFDTESLELLGRFGGAGIALGLGGIGSAIGMGMTAGNADEGIMRQPEQQSAMLRTMLIGQAVGGSPSIFALVIGLIILFVPAANIKGEGIVMMAACLGAGLSIGLGCFGSGWGCGWPGMAACEGAARNPRQSSKITQLMIVGQAVAQSPSIFAAVVALIMIFVTVGSDLGWAAMGAAMGAGLAMGASAIGSGMGSGITAGGAVHGMSRWPKSYGPAMRNMLIAQAVAQTPAIFGLLVAIILLIAFKFDNTLVGFSMALAAGIAGGFGGIGPGYGSGVAGASGCQAIVENPRLESLVLRTMLIGQAVSQSTAIYALIIVLVMLYVV
jgi:F-type H+-transporting ATPase subunit c